MTDWQRGPWPNRRRLLVAAMACTAIAFAGGARAARNRTRVPGDAGTGRSGKAATIDADTAAAAVHARCRCRILGVARGATTGGAPLWRVKVLLPQGRVRTVHVDALSGEILE